MNFERWAVSEWSKVRAHAGQLPLEKSFDRGHPIERPFEIAPAGEPGQSAENVQQGVHGMKADPAQLLFVVAGREDSALQVDFEHSQLAFAGQPDMGRLDRQVGKEIGAVRGDVLLADLDQFQRKRVARAIDQLGSQHPGSGESLPAKAISFAPHGGKCVQINAVEHRHARQGWPLAGRRLGPGTINVTAKSRGPQEPPAARCSRPPVRPMLRARGRGSVSGAGAVMRYFLVRGGRMLWASGLNVWSSEFDAVQILGMRSGAWQNAVRSMRLAARTVQRYRPTGKCQPLGAERKRGNWPAQQCDSPQRPGKREETTGRAISRSGEPPLGDVQQVAQWFAADAGVWLLPTAPTVAWPSGR